MLPLPFAKGRRYALLGLARSGLTAALALAASGAEVAAWDDAETARAKAAAAGIETRPLVGLDWREVEALVLSPGIPHSFPRPHPVAAAAKAAGTPLISDIELLVRACPEARVVGITGTNGKSTTTALVGHLLKRAGVPAGVGGNLGTPVLTLPALGREGVYVLELSSYQLELVQSLVCTAAVFLNITPDHLDRHGGFAGYLAAKKRIFHGQGAAETAVVGIDEEAGRALAEELEAAGASRVVRISVAERQPGGIYLQAGHLIDDSEGRAEALLAMDELPRLPGRHNAQNVAAAYAACRALGLAGRTVLDGLPDFPGLAHRQELVAERAGLRFVNDSKATNAEAAATALASYQDIYWIAGGRPKEGGLAGLEPYYPRLRGAFLIGEAEESFARVLAGRVPVERCGTLARAVTAASRRARAEGLPGAVVLLSPACASFDQFPDFEARGEAFRAAVAALGQERAS